jgi:predicted nucleic acid-binding protein
MARLYARLFERSLELKRDYTTYYAVEYGTFARYLRKRHLLSDEEAKELDKRFSRAATIVRFGWLYTFMQEGVGADLLAGLLDMEK